MTNQATRVQMPLTGSIPLSAMQLTVRRRDLNQSFFRRCGGVSPMTSLDPKGTFMRTIASSIGATAAMLVLLLAGCASGPIVRVDKDPNVDLRAYKTFAFFEPLARGGPLPFIEPGTHGGPLPFIDAAARGDARYTSLQTQHLQQATREQMERQGYIYDAAHPDLRVNVLLHVDEKFELRSIPGAYGYIGLGGGLESAYYRQGTLSVDLVDARRNALVWQGVAEGRVDTQAGKDPGPAIEAAVAEIFAVFPKGKGK